MEDAVPAGGWTDAESTGAGASSRPDGAGDAQGSQCDGRRLRFFDHAMRKACWEKADVVPGRHPDRWRMDAAGNTVGRRFNACMGCLCYEFDHIVPYSKGETHVQVGVREGWRRARVVQGHKCAAAAVVRTGGATSVENCQVLQTRVNRFKSDKDQLSPQEYSHASCHLTLTDTSPSPLKSPILPTHLFISPSPLLMPPHPTPPHPTPPLAFPSPPRAERDLDLVEMAVYGDVVRPGMQCRVTTVAEAMGVLPPAPRRRPTKPQQQYGACHWPGAASEQAQGSLS
ncbi:unnamed protein product [Closterium sp. Naga37s-1]|nr:unnamed protein product [Closterium sp. Naga37s-1]